MSTENKKQEKHLSKLHQLGLATTTDDAHDCGTFSNSAHACETHGCTYRAAGYITPALCYDPEKEVPGVLWGTWQREEGKEDAQQEDDIDEKVVESLENLQPFSSDLQYDQARAKRSKASPINFTPRQEKVLQKMRRRAEKIYQQLKRKGRKAFEKSDISIQTYKINRKGKKVPVSINLTPGDHIFSTGGFGQDWVEHHGVYIGRGYIVEVGGGGRVLLNLELGIGDLMCGLGVRSSPSKGVVTLNHISTFVDPRYRAGKIEYPVKERLPRAETVRKAIEHIGTWNYKLFTSNCEHFATYVVTGKFDSAQILQSAVLQTFKPLSKAMRWISPSQYDLVSNCSIHIGDASCGKTTDVCPEIKGRERGTSHVVLDCNGVRTCHCLTTLNERLNKQEQKGELPHDPETDLLLTPEQVAIIRNATNDQTE